MTPRPRGRATRGILASFCSPDQALTSCSFSTAAVDAVARTCDTKSWRARLALAAPDASRSARCGRWFVAQRGSQESCQAARRNGPSTSRRHRSSTRRHAPRPAFNAAATWSCSATARPPRRAASCARSRSSAGAVTPRALSGSGSCRHRRIDHRSERELGIRLFFSDPGRLPFRRALRYEAPRNA